MRRKLQVQLFILVFLVIVDIFVKLTASTYSLAHRFNTGVAFGLGNTLLNPGWVLIATLLVLILIIIKVIREKNKRYSGVVFLIVGGMMNMIDRICFGGVIDYLSFFQLIQFNLADVLIVIGVVLVLMEHVICLDSENKTRKLPL